MSRYLRSLVLVTASLLMMTACGSSDTDESGTRVWDEREIADHMGLTANPGGFSWTFSADDGTSCNVAVVLTSASQVNTYTGAGDVVATNPDKTAGVKIVDREAKTCVDAATDILEDLE